MSQISSETEALIKTLESQSRGWGTDSQKRRAAKEAMLELQRLASELAQTPTPEQMGRAYYLARYENDGAKWEANDHKMLWVRMAQRYHEILALADTSTSHESAPRAPKVRTSHHRNKEEAARLQKLVDERLAPSESSPDRDNK